MCVCLRARARERDKEKEKERKRRRASSLPRYATRRIQESYESPSEVLASIMWFTTPVLISLMSHRLRVTLRGRLQRGFWPNTEILVQNHSIFYDAEMSLQRNFTPIIFFPVFFEKHEK